MNLLDNLPNDPIYPIEKCVSPEKSTARNANRPWGYPLLRFSAHLVEWVNNPSFE